MTAPLMLSVRTLMAASSAPVSLASLGTALTAKVHTYIHLCLKLTEKEFSGKHSEKEVQIRQNDMQFSIIVAISCKYKDSNIGSIREIIIKS